MSTPAASSYDGLRLERRADVAIVTLANPPANTWTEDSLTALVRLVDDLAADPALRAMVVTGEGDKFFCAGAELRRFADGDRAVARLMARRFGEAFEALAAYPGVTIAAINGYAMGGGLECALACDIRLAEEQAVMALPEASVGLLPCAGGTQWLPWLVGEGWAKRMILLGERVDAARALAIGLIEEVVPRGTVLERAVALARLAARQSPASVQASKRLIQQARTLPPQFGLPAEREAFVDLFDGAQQQEGVRAFLEKRPPVWPAAHGHLGKS